MSKTKLSERIDYSAFQTGNGAANYQSAFKRTFERAHVAGRRKEVTYGALIVYLNFSKKSVSF